jgi:uncharacterized iron-regulated membrane protein
VDNGLAQSWGDRILNSFTTLHYGTFWGLPSRLFYILVGLAPAVLAITGWVMWWYRRKGADPNRPQFPSTKSIDRDRPDLMIQNTDRMPLWARIFSPIMYSSLGISLAVFRPESLRNHHRFDWQRHLLR